MYEVRQDQLNVLDKNILNRKNAIVIAKIRHAEQPGSYHEVHETGIGGVYQLKPNEDLRGVPVWDDGCTHWNLAEEIERILSK